LGQRLVFVEVFQLEEGLPRVGCFTCLRFATKSQVGNCRGGIGPPLQKIL
jgi:hypothetical protein